MQNDETKILCLGDIAPVKQACDFIIQDGSEITGAYQVCYDLHQENYERELSGLVRACKKFDLMKGYIITESTSGTITVDDVEIQIIPMTVFLLEFVE